MSGGGGGGEVGRSKAGARAGAALAATIRNAAGSRCATRWDGRWALTRRRERRLASNNPDSIGDSKFQIHDLKKGDIRVFH